MKQSRTVPLLDMRALHQPIRDEVLTALTTPFTFFATAGSIVLAGATPVFMLQAGDFPESETAAREVLALPIHSALSGQEVDYVSQQIRAFYA